MPSRPASELRRGKAWEGNTERTQHFGETTSDVSAAIRSKRCSFVTFIDSQHQTLETVTDGRHLPGQVSPPELRTPKLKTRAASVWLRLKLQTWFHRSHFFLYCFFLLNRLKRFSFSFSLSFSLLPGLDSVVSVTAAGSV